MLKLIILTPLTGARLKEVVDIYPPTVHVTTISTLEELRALSVSADTTLLTFGTSVVVPAEQLARLSKPAYNLHASSPEFPGRDPHHHAVYHRATRYGATLHVMAEKVDAGAIAATEMFDVPENVTPERLLTLANEAAVRLLHRIGAGIVANEPIRAAGDVQWGAVKTSRADLNEMCRLNLLVDGDEFARRHRAFNTESFNNLTISLHGHTFRIEKEASAAPETDTRFLDFTENGYQNLIHQLKQAGYRFENYGAPKSGRHVLWRHDVDFSMHRAGALARIEADEGVYATYFLHLSSNFYNIHEPEVLNLVKEIAGLGHGLGLHFDGAAHGMPHWTPDELEAAVARDRMVLENTVGHSVSAMSWHNPDWSNLLEFGAEEIAGLRNAYSDRLRREYIYCSDSNGYWRFKPMSEVIAEGHERLHLLTHPAWWTPEPLSPSRRIDRVILGRARAIRKQYDRQIAAGGRVNMA